MLQCFKVMQKYITPRGTWHVWGTLCVRGGAPRHTHTVTRFTPDTATHVYTHSDGPRPRGVKTPLRTKLLFEKS